MGGAHSKEGISKATAFIDSLTNLKQSGGNLLEAFTITVSPAAEKVMDFFTAGIDRFQGGAEGIGTLVADVENRMTDFMQRHRAAVRRGMQPSGRIEIRPRGGNIRDRQGSVTPRQGRAMLPTSAQFIGEFGRLGREMVAGGDADNIRAQQVRNPFPRSEADRKRIAEKALKVAEEQLLWNKREVEEFRKFNSAFRIHQNALERIGAAENF